jgi:hypothetical protein
VTETNGVPLRVRAAPGGQILTELAETTVVTVLAGPQCFNNLNWWQIRLDSSNLVGWSAEGDDEYFLEPWSGTSPQLIAPPTAVPVTPIVQVNPPISVNPSVLLLLPDGNCQLAPTEVLQVKQTVIVKLNTGSTLAMRTNVTDATPFAQITGGTTATILEGPQCHQGYRYWRIVTSDGSLTGWVVDGNAANGYILLTQ